MALVERLYFEFGIMDWRCMLMFCCLTSLAVERSLDASSLFPKETITCAGRYESLDIGVLR